MNILIAADKFKGSLTSFEVCEAIAQGLVQAWPAADIQSCPLADGGDGWAAVIQYYTQATKRSIEVCDPLMRPVLASYSIAQNGVTAFLEMAEASGLWRLNPTEYDCTLTSSFGTGQLIVDAINQGAKKIILGIGGSATNDCGMGMAAALGYRFFDAAGTALLPIGMNLGKVAAIVAPPNQLLRQVSIDVACDVTNTLTGPDGATRVYAPQKGATQAQVAEMENGMMHFAALVKRLLGVDMESITGGGAAGGVGAGSVAFLHAKLVRGADLILELAGIEAKLCKADVVITGEGKLDSQTLQGKLVAAITSLGKQYKKPVYALCGINTLTEAQLSELGIDKALPLVNDTVPMAVALQQASSLLAERASTLGAMLAQKQHLP